MSNKEFYYNIQLTALKSVYWSKKAKSYYLVGQYEYGPMIEDELFLSYWKETDVVGALEMEEAIGRRFKIEELKVCPLSVKYLLFGRPLITETQQELEKLDAFAEMIANAINRNETLAIQREIKWLNKRLIEWKFCKQKERERRNV